VGEVVWRRGWARKKQAHGPAGTRWQEGFVPGWMGGMGASPEA